MLERCKVKCCKKLMQKQKESRKKSKINKKKLINGGQMPDTQEAQTFEILDAVKQVTELYASAICNSDLDDDEFNFMYDILHLNLKYLKAKRNAFDWAKK
jgi:hypothetical protein